MALWMVVAVPLIAATTYRTERLKQIASALALRLSNDPQPGADLGTVANRNGKDIYAVTDQYGEVSHIGYRLFAPQLAEKAPDLRMDVDQVVFTRGNPALLRTLTPESNFSFDLEEIRNRFYRLTWTLGGTEGREVSLVIPANCQLIMGANAIELEQLAERDILRATPFDRKTVLNRWAESEGFRGEGVLILDGGAYMSRYIRGDLYISEQLGRDHPVCTLWQPIQSVSNLMLTGIGPGIYPLALTMNRYGGKRDLLDVTLSQYIAFCLSEGCKLYFGVKQKNDTAVTGALFAYNAKYAYTHLLDVTFPISLLGDKPAENERIRCTAYVYIPLKLLDDKLFTQDFSRITLKE